MKKSLLLLFPILFYSLSNTTAQLRIDAPTIKDYQGIIINSKKLTVKQKLADSFVYDLTIVNSIRNSVTYSNVLKKNRTILSSNTPVYDPYFRGKIVFNSNYSQPQKFSDFLYSSAASVLFELL